MKTNSAHSDFLWKWSAITDVFVPRPPNRTGIPSWKYDSICKETYYYALYALFCVAGKSSWNFAAAHLGFFGWPRALPQQVCCLELFLLKPVHFYTSWLPASLRFGSAWWDSILFCYFCSHLHSNFPKALSAPQGARPALWKPVLLSISSELKVWRSNWKCRCECRVPRWMESQDLELDSDSVNDNSECLHKLPVSV